jgi:hypothetical protein
VEPVTINLGAMVDAGLRLLQSDTPIPARDRRALTDLERLLIGISNGELRVVSAETPQQPQPEE